MTEVEFTVLCTRMGLYAVHTQGVFYALSPAYVISNPFSFAVDDRLVRRGVSARFRLEEAMLPFLSFDYQQDRIMSQMVRSSDSYPMPLSSSLTAYEPRYDSIHNSEDVVTGVHYYDQFVRRCIGEYTECELRSHVLLRIEIPGTHPFSYHLTQQSPIDGVPVSYYNRYDKHMLSTLEVSFVYEYPRYTQRGAFVQNDGGSITSTEVVHNFRKRNALNR